MKKNKLETLEFLMSNEKTSKIIKEAFDAPLGSTKREKARAILSILKRASGEDGRGSAATYMAEEKSSEPKKEYGFENYVVFPYVPDPSEDGQGQGEATNDYWSNLKNTTIGGSILGTAEKAGNTIGNALGSYVDTFWNKNPISLTNLPNTLLNYNKSVLGQASKLIPQEVKDVNTALYGYDPKTGLKIGETPGVKTTPQTSTSQQYPSTPNYNPSIFKTQEAKESPYAIAPEGDADTTGETPATDQESLTSLYDNLLNSDYGLKKVENPTTNEEKLYNMAIDAIARNTGSELFASSVLGNKNYSSLIPGAEDFFGKSLSDIRKENSDLLKEEYGVDELKNEVLNITKRNSTLKTDATNYIKGKDEYVKTLDAKLNEANDRYLSGDVSDPALQKSYENYKNYLTILKGRQEQNYQDYLQQTVDMANAELSTLSNAYNDSITSFNSAITNVNASDEETYNNIKNSLTGMYTSLSAAEETNMTKAMNYLTLAQSNINLLKMLDSNGGGNYTPDDELKMHDLAKSALTISAKSGTDTINIPKDTVNLYNEINSRDETAAKIFYDEYSSALQNYVGSEISTPEGLERYKTQIDELNQYYPNLAGKLYSIVSSTSATAADKKVINNKFNDILSKLTMYLNGRAGGAFGSGLLAGGYDATRLIKDLQALGMTYESAQKLSTSFAPYIGNTEMISSIKTGGPSSLITTINTYAQ